MQNFVCVIDFVSNFRIEQISQFQSKQGLGQTWTIKVLKIIYTFVFFDCYRG